MMTMVSLNGKVNAYCCWMRCCFVERTKSRCRGMMDEMTKEGGIAPRESTATKEITSTASAIQEQCFIVIIPFILHHYGYGHCLLICLFIMMIMMMMMIIIIIIVVVVVIVIINFILLLVLLHIT